MLAPFSSRMDSYLLGMPIQPWCFHSKQFSDSLLFHVHGLGMQVSILVIAHASQELVLILFIPNLSFFWSTSCYNLKPHGYIQMNLSIMNVGISTYWFMKTERAQSQDRNVLFSVSINQSHLFISFYFGLVCLYYHSMV